MGNKTKYCKAIVAKICRFIESGLNNKQACAAAGVSETSLLVWRKLHPDFESKIEAAREIMRAAVLAKIRAAGASDWKALECFLRLSFSEYRFSSNSQVNVAIQNNLAVSDPERARLIEMRNNALANNSVASEPLQIEDKSGASDAREIAEEAERNLGAPPKPTPEPPRLREHPPKTVVERAEWREAARRQAYRDEVDEILDG